MAARGDDRYDLEERTFAFAQRVVRLSRRLPKDITNVELIRQLVRAAGSVGANYIEANEALSRKDFAYRIKISKKEAKDARYWLHLVKPKTEKQQEECRALAEEATELVKIFAAILRSTRKGARS